MGLFALIGSLLNSDNGIFAPALVTAILCAVLIPLTLNILKVIGFYTIVEERFAQVYTLFGTVELVLTEPGLYFLWPKLSWKALIIMWLGKRYVVDLRLDQQYLRSLAVNSEEGAPMGIGVWYEMAIIDPVAYLFKNEDPRGSLGANVSNSTIRSLSNLPLAEMLVDRHRMSQVVRSEVSPDSDDWGYRLGSVYIRKVHFRDPEMIAQIQSKVVNRLRQVTSAIKQDGANQVNIITSSAEKTAASEFAKAGAMRPAILGAVLQEIAKDKDVSRVLFESLEVEKLLESKAEIDFVPKNAGVLSSLLTAQK
jgi:regulator of protease activity HflC (stomatin/prohibitin superfamily)